MARNKRTISIVNPDGSVREAEHTKQEKEALDIAREMSYMSLGYYIATPIIIGVFGGWWLDQKFGTKPTITLIAIGIGAVAAFYNLYKIIKNA